MLNSILLGAALLLQGFVVPSTAVNVEARPMSAIVVAMEETINYDMEKLLLENYAAPYWDLTNEKAWEYYQIRRIRIDEITPNVYYKIHFDGGLLEVVLEGAGI
jgi:hypothetical protein